MPVGFTLTPGTIVKELLDEALGLFLHCRWVGDTGDGKNWTLGSSPSPLHSALALAQLALTTHSRRELPSQQM